MTEPLLALVSILESTIRLATPLVLAALAGLFSERAGVIDIGLEGKMLGAAFAAAAVAHLAGSPWPGLAAGIGAAVALALVHGFASIAQRGNQVVSGIALNILVAGLAPTLALAWFDAGGNTPPLAETARFRPVAPALPVIGGHDILTYLAAAAVPLAAFVLYRTRFGLRLRAVGENPHAVDAAGISVAGLRYAALVWGGVLCGVAGAYLATAQNAGFIRDMTAGRGFLALAALIFGKWRPVPALFACLLFAFADALQARLQGVALPLVGAVPVQLFQAAPYVLTVLLLAGFIGGARPPSALGQPFARSR
jgi:general nucleoside transport system permease protein